MLERSGLQGVDVTPSNEGGVVLGSSALAVVAVLVSEVMRRRRWESLPWANVTSVFSQSRVAWLGGDLFYTRG